MGASGEPTAEPPLFPRLLVGERIELSELAEDGLVDMARYSRDARLYDHLELAPHLGIEDTRHYFETLRRRCEGGTAHYWFIRMRKTFRVIGTFGVTAIDWRVPRAEIGYGLDPALWGGGYFSETLQVALDFLFLDAGFHRIAAKTAVTNERSIRALERNGFRREGVMQDYYLMRDGRRVNAAVLALLKSEWRPAPLP